MQRAAPSRHLSSALSSWPQMRVDSDLPDHAHQPVARIEQSDMRASWFEARSGANPASSGPISSASANHLRTLGIARLARSIMLTRQSPTAKAIKRSRCVTALYLIGESKSSVTMAASVTALHHRFSKSPAVIFQQRKRTVANESRPKAAPSFFSLNELRHDGANARLPEAHVTERSKAKQQHRPC